MKRFRFFLQFVILLFLLAKISFAQLSFESEYENYYDDNIYNNYLKTQDWIHSLTLSSDYNFESEVNNLNFYWLGNYSYYQKNIFKTSLTNRIGIANTYLFGESENPINIGINYTSRKNRDDFELFDLEQYSFYSNYKHSFDESEFAQLGYLFRKNVYKNFSLFSHYENKGFLSYTKFFPTKTTLILRGEINNKTYVEKLNLTDVINSMNQAIVNIHLAQSLTEKTGLAGYFTYRKNLNDGARYSSVNDYILYEEDVFNDLYSNDGFEFGLSLTQLLPYSLQGKFEFKYELKNFNGMYAYDLFGEPLTFYRQDKNIGFGIELEKKLYSLISGLSLRINYNFIINQSNDRFYKYNNNLFYISLNYGM